MNYKGLQYVLIVSFTGFLFGFDSVVISGVNLPLKHFWNTSDWFHGTFIISISLWGTLVGALLGGYPTEALGRKPTLIIVGTMFLISGLGTALATKPEMFSFFRFIGGLSTGLGSIAAPTYISETASPKNRGKLGMLFQLNIVLGILMAFLSNYFFTGISENNDWRYMLGVLAIPASIYTVLLFSISESPRWLIVARNNTEKALAIMNSISSKNEVNNLLNSLKKEDLKNNRDSQRLFSGKYNRILILSLLMTFFNQFSGISFILFYAPEILEKAGFGTSESLLSSVSIGVVNLLFTIIGIYLIDKIGRKQLMYWGSVGYIISLSMTACSFYFSLSAIVTLIFILLFIISHAIGQGAVIWVFIAEIFPTKIRPYGQAWGSGLLNGFAALIALFGAVLINNYPSWLIFTFFAVLMVFQLLFTYFMMPETKGVSLEELESQIVTQSNYTT